MAERTNIPQDESLKRAYYRSLKKNYGDRIILVDREGSRYELDGLGQAFQGLHNFFTWLLDRGGKPWQPMGRGQVDIE
jgi:hypothetical protein